MNFLDVIENFIPSVFCILYLITFQTMPFIWIILLYLMADGICRGRDKVDHEDPPYLLGGSRGQHELDVKTYYD